MSIFSWIVVACWVAFLLVWFVMGVGAKRDTGSFVHWFWLRALLLVVALALFHSKIAAAIAKYHPVATGDPILGATGAVLCALGLIFAVWARVTLGRNWGMPMSVKEHPELVTSGPYAYVRHPIYTGVLAMMLGSALVSQLVWLVPLALFGAYFIYSATREEKLMLATFPEAYPAYKARTKMLVPFLF